MRKGNLGLVVRWLLGVVVVVPILAGAGAAWLWMRGWADIRTDLVKERGMDQELAIKGRVLLHNAARQHGSDEIATHTTFSITATDQWSGDGPWWPEPVQSNRADRLLGTFTSRVRLVGGPLDGEIWGIQSWHAYEISNGSDRPVFGPSRAIEFYLPTLQYFDELPFRLVNAPIVLFAGTGRYRGLEYDRVFVTWGSVKPHRDHDQYELWINRATGRIDVARYTLREGFEMASGPMKLLMRAFAAGTIHFEDYREVEGVAVPFRSTVTLTPPEKTELPLDRNYFHRIVVEDAAFDRVERESLIVDRNLGIPADRKPGG